jgi:hypothetical protein
LDHSHLRMQNSWKDHPRSINPPQRPAYPAEFKKLFEGPDAPRGGYMWISPRDPSLLDYKNAIFVLIGRSPNLGVSTCPYQRATRSLFFGQPKELPLEPGSAAVCSASGMACL